VPLPLAASAWGPITEIGSCQVQLPVGSPTGAKIAIHRSGSPAQTGPDPLNCYFSGVSEGTRTPDTQDHNLVL
jgi:hypothetical protein